MGIVVTASVVIWLVIGLVVAVIMVRRGHAPSIWFALSFYGPLLILLALTAVQAESENKPEIVHQGRPGSGEVAVLVGIDASPESYAALDEVIALLGPQLGQLTLAHVIDHDDDQIPDGSDGRARAIDLLDKATEHVSTRTNLIPASALLVGRAGPALAQHANEGDYNLIAVGSRGRGATRLVLGSTAAHLSAAAKPPVLIIREGTSEWWTRSDSVEGGERETE